MIGLKFSASLFSPGEEHFAPTDDHDKVGRLKGVKEVQSQLTWDLYLHFSAFPP